jgi:CRP/FNR family cyclic AMP-dependent transcriptional regulator
MKHALLSKPKRKPMAPKRPARPPKSFLATAPFNAQSFLATVGSGKTSLTRTKEQIIFSQGDASDAVFYLEAGRVELTVVSQQGKEAVVAILEPGAFFGEACLTGQTVRTATSTAHDACTLIRIEKTAMIQVLHENPVFSALFLAYLLSRNVRIEEDLVDHLFNSSEKRLARVLLLLAHFGKEGTPQAIIPQLSQHMLAKMIGTTRSRVSFFMNKFRKLGFIEYNGGMHMHVHSSLLNVVLHD